MLPREIVIVMTTLFYHVYQEFRIRLHEKRQDAFYVSLLKSKIVLGQLKNQQKFPLA